MSNSRILARKSFMLKRYFAKDLKMFFGIFLSAPMHCPSAASMADLTFSISAGEMPPSIKPETKATHQEASSPAMSLVTSPP